MAGRPGLYANINAKRKRIKGGAKSYMQSIYLGYLYTRWKKLKGYDKFDPKPNEGQCQSSIQEFFQTQNKLK